jgi:hypothetical protein
MALGVGQKRHEFDLENGNKFFIRRYDPFLALKILGEVQKRFLGPFAAIMEARDVVKPVGRSDGGNGQDQSLQALATSPDAFANAVERLSKSLDGDALVAVAKLVLNSDYVSVVVQGEPPARLDEGLLNRSTDGVYDVVALVVEVLKYNYADLFTRGRTLIGQVQSDMASQ